MRAVRLTPCALALVAPFVLLGCKESLFDDSTSSTKADAGTSNTVDGGVTGCATPCLGDAVGEWTGEQGGSEGRFHYRDLGRDPGHDAAAMTLGQYMGKPAFLGRGTPQDAIAACKDLGGASCAGATVVALDLRQLMPVGNETTLALPLQDGPDVGHLLAPKNLRLCQPATDDSRVRWHSELSTAWRAWSASCT